MEPKSVSRVMTVETVRPLADLDTFGHDADRAVCVLDGDPHRERPNLQELVDACHPCSCPLIVTFPADTADRSPQLIEALRVVLAGTPATVATVNVALRPLVALKALPWR